ncbi:unnamed protein product, partial [Protopolystoma xenopodis]
MGQSASKEPLPTVDWQTSREQNLRRASGGGLDKRIPERPGDARLGQTPIFWPVVGAAKTTPITTRYLSTVPAVGATTLPTPSRPHLTRREGDETVWGSDEVARCYLRQQSMEMLRPLEEQPFPGALKAVWSVGWIVKMDERDVPGYIKTPFQRRSDYTRRHSTSPLNFATSLTNRPYTAGDLGRYRLRRLFESVRQLVFEDKGYILVVYVLFSHESVFPRPGRLSCHLPPWDERSRMCVGGIRDPQPTLVRSETPYQLVYCVSLFSFLIHPFFPSLPCRLLLPPTSFSWYHAALSRLEAEHLLKPAPAGSFLVRLSETSRAEF